jgi:hypothetical protein
LTFCTKQTKTSLLQDIPWSHGFPTQPSKIMKNRITNWTWMVLEQMFGGCHVVKTCQFLFKLKSWSFDILLHHPRRSLLQVQEIDPIYSFPMNGIGMKGIGVVLE